MFGDGEPDIRVCKKINDEYRLALNRLVIQTDLSKQESQRAIELYNQFKKMKKIASINQETDKIEKSQLHQKNISEAGVVDSVINNIKVVIPKNKTIPLSQEFSFNSDSENISEGFIGGSRTPTPKHRNEIRESIKKYDLIINNVDMCSILKVYKTGGILDTTNIKHQMFFNSSTWNFIKKDTEFGLDDEINPFITKIGKLDLVEARLELDRLIIPDNENNDFHLNQMLEDPCATERTYTCKFLVPIIDSALSCVHPRLRLQWCECKSASNIMKLKMDNVLKDGRDGALLDSLGTLNNKYDLVALEVAGKPLSMDLPKITNDKSKINEICKEMVNFITCKHPFVERCDLEQVGVVCLQAFGFHIEAAMMTLEGPECWVVRNICSAQLPTNFTEINLVKKIIRWGLALRETLEKIIFNINIIEDREDSVIPWSRFILETDDFNE
nr:11739_t:CDS:2 [Entrophospora candida]